MIRKAFLFLVMFTMALQAGREGLLLLWYQVENGSFERAFCANIDRPELECHGKCVFSAFASKVNDPENVAPVSTPLSRPWALPFLPVVGFLHAWMAYLPYKHPRLSVRRSVAGSPGFLPSVFHPPRV